MVNSLLRSDSLIGKNLPSTEPLPDHLKALIEKVRIPGLLLKEPLKRSNFLKEIFTDQYEQEDQARQILRAEPLDFAKLYQLLLKLPEETAWSYQLIAAKICLLQTKFFEALQFTSLLASKKSSSKTLFFHALALQSCEKWKEAYLMWDRVLDKENHNTVFGRNAKDQQGKVYTKLLVSKRSQTASMSCLPLDDSLALPKMSNLNIMRFSSSNVKQASHFVQLAKDAIKSENWVRAYKLFDFVLDSVDHKSTLGKEVKVAQYTLLKQIRAKYELNPEEKALLEMF